MSRLWRLVPGLLLFLCAGIAPAQDGWVYRTQLGTYLGTNAEGVPRHREDDGWSSGDYTQARWGVWYGTTLSTSPWIAVHQADRTNAALNALTNKLTLDLNGGTYSLLPYNAGGTVKGGLLTVYDQHGSGAYLKITNGTFDNSFSTGLTTTTVGSSGKAGRLIVEQATLKGQTTRVGDDSGATASVILGDGGQMTSIRKMSVGLFGSGSVELQGAGSSLQTGPLTIGNVAGGHGTVTLSHATARLNVLQASVGGGDLIISNAVTAQPGTNIGLRLNDGTAFIERDLWLATTNPQGFGAVLIENGTLHVGRSVHFGSSTSETVGGKIFLHGGRFEVASPTALAPGSLKNFYWKAGTLGFTGATATLTDTRLGDYTRQGALSYSGGRATGTLATGQVLEAAGQLTLTSASSAPVKLAGGTIRAEDGLVLATGIEGYGTLDAVVSGTAAITNTTGNPLSVGALGGSNTLVSSGELQVGSRNVDASFAGTSSGSGTFAKVGTGTQTIAGHVSNTAVEARQGVLAFDGVGQRLESTALTVSEGAAVRFSSGAAGTVSGNVTNAGSFQLTGGTLDIDELFLNHGLLINNGMLNADVVGPGRVTGAGTFAGDVTIAGGSVLAPGNSPGSAIFEDLTLGPGGAFELEFAAANGTAGLEWDLASVGGVLAITATAANPYTVLLKTLDASLAPGALADFDPTRSYTWKFLTGTIIDPNAIDLTAFRVDTSGFLSADGFGGGSFTMTAETDGLALQFAPVSAPEPGSMTLLLLAGLAAGGEHLRRRAARRRGLRSSVLPVARSRR